MRQQARRLKSRLKAGGRPSPSGDGKLSSWTNVMRYSGAGLRARRGLQAHWFEVGCADGGHPVPPHQCLLHATFLFGDCLTRMLTCRPRRGTVGGTPGAATSVAGLLILLLILNNLALAQPARSNAQANPLQRGLKICVAASAPASIHHLAESVLAAVKTNPLLTVMASGNAPAALTDTRTLLTGPVAARAYGHLVLIGLPDDPLILAAWQREARVEVGGFYVFGFGHLRGDIGYIESDRNPFMHGAAIKVAPYETEVVTLTGTDEQGVALATGAFLQQGLVNGLVAAPGWTRPQPSLLQRDPLAPNFTSPDWLPQRIGEAVRIGVTPASEDEYRGVLADVGVEPQAIWRAKYFPPGAWDGAGAARAFDNYSAGLHRRAYGNTLWCAQFGSAAAAAQAAPKIAAAANLRRVGDVWTGAQPPYGPEKASAGDLALWQQNDWVLMSTLPARTTTTLRQILLK